MEHPAHSHLIKQWGADPPCPYCGSRVWEVGGLEQLLTAASVFVPMYVVGCGCCGHTTFVRADKVEEG